MCLFIIRFSSNRFWYIFYFVSQEIRELSFGEIIEDKQEYLDVAVADRDDEIDDEYINCEGEVAFSLFLTFKIPAVSSAAFQSFRMAQFFELSHVKLHQNLTTLIGNELEGDLKIVTSDGAELIAHKNILKGNIFLLYLTKTLYNF